MKVDTGINLDLHAIPSAVKTIESQGYDGVRTAEMNHDPFFPLLLAAEHTESLGNMRLNLRAQAHGKTTLGICVEVMTDVRQVHWAARKSNGNRAGDF